MANNFALKAILMAQNKISPVLKAVMKDVAKTSQAFAGIGKGLGGMAAASLPFAAVGGMAGFAAKSMLDTTAQFEKYGLVLETLEGSQAKAAKSLAWISDFAAKTPYELAEVTESFVKLKSYGIDPIQGQTLRVLGDTAAAMGKDVNQAVEALADAVTGENERLKEFGIVGKKAGKDILYAYTDKTGKQRVARARADSREQIRLTLMAIWNEKYGGSMDKLSNSWSGMLSNLKDQFARFSTMVMNSGAFNWLKGRLGDFLKQIELLGQKPVAVFGTFSAGVADTRSELEKLAETVGAQILDGLKEFWAAAKSVASVVVEVKDAVGGWGNLFKLTTAIMAGPLILATVQTIGAVFSFGVALFRFARIAAIAVRALAALRVAAMALMIFTAANPIVLAVVATIALLAGAAYLVYKNWEPIKAWFIGLWLSVKDACSAAVDWMMSKIRPLIDLVKTISNAFDWKNGPTMGDVQINGGGNQYGAARPDVLARPANRPNLIGAAQSRVNGEINVRFDNAPPGMRVDAPAAKQGGVAINPDVGYRSAYLGG